MSSEQPNPFLITPPPGLFPERVDEGLEESGTRKIVPNRDSITVRPPVAGGVPYVAPTTLDVSIASPIPVAIHGPAPETAPTQVAAAATTTGWRLMLPDGQCVACSAAMLIGRNPSSAGGEHLVAVNDETKTVSKTHARLDIDEAGLWVTDLDSTNGVVITRTDAADVQAEPQQRAAVPQGAVLVLGEFAIHVDYS